MVWFWVNGYSSLLVYSGGVDPSTPGLVYGFLIFEGMEEWLWSSVETAGDTRDSE